MRNKKYTKFELVIETTMKYKYDLKIKEMLHDEYVNCMMKERDMGRKPGGIFWTYKNRT